VTEVTTLIIEEMRQRASISRIRTRHNQREGRDITFK
jgi:hypothetical protein